MGKGTKKKMAEFELSFISAVDRPAQEPATMAILKRATAVEKKMPAPGKKEARGDFIARFMDDETMKGEYPKKAQRTAVANQAWRDSKGVKKADDETQAVFVGRLLDEGLIDEGTKDADVKKMVAMTLPTDGHSHLVYTMREDGGEAKSGHTSWTNDHSHPWILNDVGGVEIGDSMNHTHGIGTMTKNEPAREATMDKEQVAKLEKRLAKAEQLATLNDEHKAHYFKLADEAQPVFLMLDESKRQGEIDLAKGDDPVVYTGKDGSVYRKSDDSRLVTMAKERDEDRVELAKERTARRDAEYAKRAREELKALPGEVDTHVALLKAVDEIADEDLRKKVTEVIKAADNGLAKAFETRGVTDRQVEPGSPHTQLEAMARKRADEKGESFEKAYSTVIQTDEGRELYAEHCRTHNPTE